ncbi:MAG: DUF1269 domain-containing protein [Caldilineaceae bacterium]|nr:DUF1269 domain-containing protein [Caldilineaceae bacterium]
MASQDTSAVYNIVAYAFPGKNKAAEVVETIKDSDMLADVDVVAQAIVSVDENGKSHISEPGHGVLGTSIGAVTGGLLGLIGGPAGLLAWTVAGAVIGGVSGKYLGQMIPPEDLEQVGAAMQPNTSMFMMIVEDSVSEQAIKDLGGINANAITLTVGDAVSGELAQYVAAAVGPADDGNASDDGDSSDDSDA